MLRQQLARRDRAAERHDRALIRWPDRAGEGFATELAAVIAELTALCAELDHTTDPIEGSRTWRYLGGAYFDLARGTDRALLESSAEAYGQAETLLASIDVSLEKAKLNFSFANTLRELSGGRDRQLLEEAQLRYLLALATFRQEAPHFVSQVQAALDSLRAVLARPDLRGEAGSSLHELKAIETMLQHPGAGAEVQRQAARLLAQFAARRAARR
jgi:hypothetical protein